MPRAPRILRTAPSGRVVRAREPIPVVVRIRWHRGEVSDVRALAVAWTDTAVEIDWTTPTGDRRTDWVPAADVRRAKTWEQ
jgi:hypothetical protein